VVTVFDAVFYLESPKKLEKEFERINATKVEDLYTKDVFTIDEKTEIDEIATVMTQKKIYTIPVVDGDRIVGIIGKADLIRTIVS
jgi:predicted transcriptional regulator